MRIVKLKDVANFQAGYGFPREYQGLECGDFPFAKVGDISEVARSGQTEISSARNFINRETVQLINAKVLPKGSIVFAKIGEAISQNFRAITGCDMLIDNNTMGMIPNQRLVDSRYLFHYMRQIDLYPLASTTSVPALRKSTLEELQIPLPSLEEQRRIAAILDCADSLRRKRRSALAKLDTLLQSTFLDMFGDPITNPKKWTRLPLMALLLSIDSGWSPICEEYSASLDEWGVLKLGSVTTCRYIDKQNKALPKGLTPKPNLEVKEGDILFTRKNTRELIAACVLVGKTRPKLMLSDLIFRLNIKSGVGLLPQYLWALLTHPGKRKTIQALAGGAAGSMPNISKSKLMTVEIEVPPLGLQQKFAQIYVKLEDQRLALEASLQELNDLFYSLQQRAFRGELTAMGTEL